MYQLLITVTYIRIGVSVTADDSIAIVCSACCILPVRKECWFLLCSGKYDVLLHVRSILKLISTAGLR